MCITVFDAFKYNPLHLGFFAYQLTIMRIML